MVEDVLAGSQHEEEDEDSLFGSPPPSPRGRSPSPTLALPSHGNGLNEKQNVGTIALPGSHLYSELPMNPLALSLSHPQASRPPAQGSSNPSATRDRAPQQKPRKRATTASAPTQQKKKNAKSKESTPRPSGPEITLPDPSAPPPPNFLRSQSALLGTAGLVGGIKPSQLSTNRHTRGTTSSNPIVVDDEDEPPAIGRSRYRSGVIQSIDPSKLPAPSNQDIVAMLIGQKDIFPVLESILKLIASGAATATKPRLTGFERKIPAHQPHENTSSNSDNSSRSTKKRKLNRVPAGAADWDVPYPFAQGEGPEEYRTNWERQRGKQLIAQLVNLIKIAARKAAMKNYLQNEENRKKYEEERKKLREESRRKEVIEIDGPSPSPSEVLVDKSNELSSTTSSNILSNNHAASALLTNSAMSTATSGTATPNSNFASAAQLSGYSQLPHLPSGQQSQTQSTAAFDQLISSLLSAPPAQGLSSGDAANLNKQSSAVSNSSNASGGVSAGESSGSISPVDQALFDSWMGVLQTFPVPSGGFNEGQDLTSTTSSSTSTPGPGGFSLFSNDTGFDFTGMNFDMEGTNPSIPDFDAMMANFSDNTQFQTISNAMDVDQRTTIMDNVGDAQIPSQRLPDDNVIDPSLLAISIPQSVEHDDLMNIFSEECSINPDHRATQSPSLAPSPNPSAGSTVGHNGPATPNSAIWDMSLPDIFTATDNQDNVGANGGLVDPARVGMDGLDPMGISTTGYGNTPHVRGAKGKEKAIIQGSLQQPASSNLTTSVPAAASGSLISKTPPMSAVSPAMGSSFSSSKPSPSLSLASSVFLSSLFPSSTPASSSLAKLSTLSTSVPGPIGVKTLKKQGVLRRGKERRQQLAAELEMIKTQLWETTIEQGVLAHVVRQYNELSSSSSSTKPLI